MCRRKVLRMFRFGLVAAMVVAVLMIGIDMAAAYTHYEKQGFDSFPSKAEVDLEVDTTGNGTLDTKLPGIILEGPTVVRRSTPMGDDGNDPRPGEPDGLNDIETEIVEMELTGATPLGPIIIRAGSHFGLPPSTGAIEENAPGTDFPADSFFDVFFELTGTLYGPLTNSDPARVEAEINGIPPYNVDYTSNETVELKDAGNVTRVRLLHVRHTPLPPPRPPLPPPKVPGMTGWGIMAAVIVLAALSLVILARKRRAERQSGN